MADEPKLWAALPYALALIFTLPDWHSVGVNLERDGLAANTHCLVHALDALLSFVEPHMPREEHEPISESGVTKAAHRTFLHVASLILLDRRRSLAEAISQQPQQPGGKDAREVASKERSIAAILLVLEQLSQLAEPLGYGDLQPYLPASMLLASYGAIAQPVSVDGGDADTGAAPDEAEAVATEEAAPEEAEAVATEEAAPVEEEAVPTEEAPPRAASPPCHSHRARAAGAATHANCTPLRRESPVGPNPCCMHAPACRSNYSYARRERAPRDRRLEQDWRALHRHGSGVVSARRVRAESRPCTLDRHPPVPLRRRSPSCVSL